MRAKTGATARKLGWHVSLTQNGFQFVIAKNLPPGEALQLTFARFSQRLTSTAYSRLNALA